MIVNFLLPDVLFAMIDENIRNHEVCFFFKSLFQCNFGAFVEMLHQLHLAANTTTTISLKYK